MIQLVLVTLLLCCCIHINSAFMVISSLSIINHWHHDKTYVLLFSTKTPPIADHDWNNINAIEAARQKFEYLIGPSIFDERNDCSSIKTNSKNTIQSTNTKKKTHLLTLAGRKRREIEIRLLQSLQYSDDAIDELMTLWIYECPHQIVSIDIIQFLSSQDASCTIQETEFILRNIMIQTEVCSSISVWSEPGARLAYILFVQERYDECEQYVTSVLSVKPWHFEMIQLQILLELTYHHNISRAIYIARQYGLPPLHHNKQRLRWVQYMTQQAQNQLQQLELYTSTELYDGSCGPISKEMEESDHSNHTTVSSIPSSSIISSWE